MKIWTINYTKRTPLQDLVEVTACLNPSHVVSLCILSSFAPGATKPYSSRVCLQLQGQEDRLTLNEYTQQDVDQAREKLEMLAAQGRQHPEGAEAGPAIPELLELLTAQGPGYLAKRRQLVLQEDWQRHLGWRW